MKHHFSSLARPTTCIVLGWLILAASLVVPLARSATGVDSVDFRLSEMPAYQPGKPVTQIIRIAGFYGARKLLENWEKGFLRFHPDARIEFNYSGKGSETVPAWLYTQLADLGLMRELWRSESLSFYRVFSTEPYVINAVTGSYNAIDKTAAMIVVVNKGNPVEKLTMKQLDGIFGEARTGGYEGMYWSEAHARGPEENIRTWGDLGVGGAWKDKPIHVYGYDLQNGFAHYFGERVLHGGTKWNSNLQEFGFSIAKEGKTKGEMGIKGRSHDSGSAPLVETIEGDPYGIGYCIPRDQSPGVRAVALADEGSTSFVQASKKTVANRSYPLTRSIYWVLHRAPGEPIDAKVKEFLRYVLSREGQEEVVREGDWIPLTPELLREALKQLE